MVGVRAAVLALLVLLFLAPPSSAVTASRAFTSTACQPEDVESGRDGTDGVDTGQLVDFVDGDPHSRPCFGGGGGGGGGGGAPPEPSGCPGVDEDCLQPPTPESLAYQAGFAVDSAVPSGDEGQDDPDTSDEADTPVPTEVPPLPGDPPASPPIPGPLPAWPEIPGVVVRTAPLDPLVAEESVAFGREHPPFNVVPRLEPAAAGEKQTVTAAAPSTPAALIALALVSVGTVIYAAFAAFYNHLSRDGVATHPVRRQILEIVARDPGLGCAEAAKQLGVHLTTAQHHLRILTKWKFLLAKETPLGLRYFSSNAEAPREDAWQSGALLRNKVNAQFLQAALARGGRFRTADIARELGIAHSTASYRARKLVNAGFLESDGRTLLVSATAAHIVPAGQPRMPAFVVRGSLLLRTDHASIPLVPQARGSIASASFFNPTP